MDRSPAPSLSWTRRLPAWIRQEPARPEWIARRPDAPWLVVGTVCVGAFMGQLDASIVSLALPTLHRDFHVSLGGVEWVSLSYLLVLVSIVVLVGRAADMIGRKLLYTYGFGVFILGSALCGLAPSLLLLIGARVIQALGAAMLQANSVALITQAMPPDRLGRGIGVQGAAQAVGLGLGPALGGFLIAAGGWRLIFFVNVPAGLVGMLLGWFLLPRSRNLLPRTRFDWLGASLFIPMVALLLVALSLASDLGWTSPVIIASAVLVLGLAPLFFWRERRVSNPLIAPSLFRRVPFSAGIVSGLLSYLVLFGLLFVVPFYLELSRGLSTTAAGLILTVVPVAIGVVAPAAGRTADRFGARPVTAAGMVLTAAALAAIAFIREPEWVLLTELGAAGLGVGLFTPANNAAIMGNSPRGQYGLSGGVLNMTRGLGTSLGVALTGLILVEIAGTSRGVSRMTDPVALTRGFHAAMLFLAACAVIAASVSLARGTRGVGNPRSQAGGPSEGGKPRPGGDCTGGEGSASSPGLTRKSGFSA